MQQFNVDDWEYKCEGIGNIILTYTGTNEEFIGCVLRIRKKSEFEESMSLSGENHDTQNYVFAYVNRVMERLIGSTYVKPGRMIHLDSESAKQFLSQLDEKIRPMRPEHRLQGDPIDVDATTVLLLPDHTVMHLKELNGEEAINSSPYAEGGDTFCVEIKPKWGMLCRSHLIKVEHRFTKFNYCRYCMHQVLKQSDGKIEKTSLFCPIDLYSGDRERIIHALRQLVHHPQNNFRVYVNSLLCWHADMEKHEDHDYAQQLQALLLKHKFHYGTEENETDDQNIIEDFIDTIYHALDHSSVLQFLQRVQLLDIYDVEIANQILQQLLQKYSIETLHSMLFPFEDHDAFENIMMDLQSELNQLKSSVLTNDFRCNRFIRMHDETDANRVSLEMTHKHHSFQEDIVERCANDENLAMHTLRMFLVAQCAKDCSVMIAFDSRRNRKHLYELGIVDLDPKPVTKIPHYSKLDHKIVELFIQHHHTSLQNVAL